MDREECKDDRKKEESKMRMKKTRVAALILAIIFASAFAIFTEKLSLAQEIASRKSAKGVNVAYHTKEEITEFIKNSGADEYDKVTYTRQPSYKTPYNPGMVSDDTTREAIAMLNNIRYIAGLSANVTVNDEYTERAQAAALISAVNGTISHSPTKPGDMEDVLYHTAGSGCNSSNLGAGHPTLNYSIVHGWMGDGDERNRDRVGHRRWILNPVMGQTGFGAVTDTEGAYRNYYAMYAFDRSNVTANESGVVWPAQVMPIEYFLNTYPWSYSFGKEVNASAVHVKLTRKNDGNEWNFSSEDADGYFNVDNSGYGQRGCIIFMPDDISYNEDDVFSVEITGLSVPVSYTVEFFRLEKSADAPDSRETDEDESPGEDGAVSPEKLLKKAIVTKNMVISKGRSRAIKVTLPKDLKKVSIFTGEEGQVKITYKSSNKKVADVTQSGKVKAKKSGIAKIKVRLAMQNGERRVCTVRIRVKR